MNDDTDKQTAENGSTASLPPSGDDGRGEAGRFAPGNAGGPGRPAGGENKLTAALKDDILMAYQQRGGVDWLRSLADREFVRLIQRVLPRDLHIEAGGGAIPLQIVMFGQRPSLEDHGDAEARTPGLT